MSVRSLNKVLLIGNLTRDPEIRYTANGTPVATFGLATNKAIKSDDGQNKELTEFHNIVAWGKMAEICQQILAKGMKVFIEGSLSTRSWDDDNGVTRYKTEIRVTDMILLDNKGKSGVGGANASSGEASTASESVSGESFEEISLDDSADGGKKKDEDPLSDDMPF